MQPITFGLWLKKLRAEHDLTQEMLSELVGCATPTLRSFELGSRRPSRDMVERIAEVLKVPSEQRDEFMRLARLPVETQTKPQPDPVVYKPAVQKPLEPSTPQPPSFNVPQPLNPLIGREAERKALQTLLVEERSRLVTMVGAGGIGKTRLAVDVATLVAAHFPDGVVFVPLSALRTAAYLPTAIAEALQLPIGGDNPGEQVLATLASRRLLLVLDSFEELLREDDDDAAVAWVNRLLQQTAHVQVLITSRERLRLRNERLFELDGLSLSTALTPSALSDAVLFFLERAQQTTPDFRIDSSNKAAVARICQLVDGIPLGIELAAAWVNVLAPDEISHELESNIDFLARANRDTNPRHRSMRAVFDHSWALLNAEERETLERLAVFRGGCQREAAQTVAKATLPLLARLIDKSLVRRRQTERQARYELHEVIRQYAGEKRRAVTPDLDNNQQGRGLEQDEVWLAHYTYFYKLVATARPHLYGGEQLQWLRVLDEEYANLRAALDRCLRTQDLARGLQLANQLEEYWYIRGYHGEGLQRLLDFLNRDPAALSPNDGAQGFVAATILAIASGNYTAAQNYLDRCLNPIRQAGDQGLLAKILRYGGLIALHEADYAKAEVFASEALVVARSIKNYSEQATTLSHLAEIALIQQNYARAQEFGEQAVQILRMIGDKNQLAGSLRRLAQAHIQQGQWATARQEALESLALNNEVGDQRGTAASIVMLTPLLAAQEQWPAVAQLLGAAHQLLTRSQASLLPADQLVYDALWQQALAHASDFHTQYEAGRARMAQEQRPPYHLDWIHQFFG